MFREQEPRPELKPEAQLSWQGLTMKRVRNVATRLCWGAGESAHLGKSCYYQGNSAEEKERSRVQTLAAWRGFLSIL